MDAIWKFAAQAEFVGGSNTVKLDRRHQRLCDAGRESLARCSEA
jgi:hypothetical protein